MEYTIEVAELPVRGRTFVRDVIGILKTDGRIPTPNFGLSEWTIGETSIIVTVTDDNSEAHTVTLEVST